MRRHLLPVLLAAAVLAGACSKPVVTTPAPRAPAPAPSAVALPVERAPQAFAKSAVPKGATLPAFGLAFFKVLSGEGEVYTSPILPESSITPVHGGRRLLQVADAKQIFLTDRISGKAWTWDPFKMQVIASGDDLLLFELRESGATRYVVADKELQAVSSFTAKAGNQWAFGSAVFSPDGTKLLLRAHDRALHLVETATGKVQELGQAGQERTGYTISPGEITLSPDGKEIRVITNHYQASKEFQALYSANVQRFDWSGKETLPMLTVPGLNPKVSPNGSWVSYEILLEGKFPTAVIADSRTGVQQAWAYSASTCYQDGGTLGGQWTDYSRGVMVRTNTGYQVLTPTGELLRNGAFDRPMAEPMPAPDNYKRWALRDRSVVNDVGEVLLPAPKVAQGTPGDLMPFVGDSEEIVVGLPHLGHGNRCGFDLVLPPNPQSVKTAIYNAPFVLQANTPGDCLNLRTEPNGSVVTCVKDGTELEVTADKALQPKLLTEQPLIAGAHWAHVKAKSGEQGWIALKPEFLKWAPSRGL